MNQHDEAPTQAQAKKSWQTPRIDEQTVHSATAKGKATSPSEGSPGTGLAS